MGRYGIGMSFKGRYTTFPEVGVSINPDNLDLRPQSPLGVVAILAQGAGFFPPGKGTSLPLDSASPQRFISPSDLLVAAEFAVRPFAQLDRGTGQVIVVPVNPSTPATKALNTSGPALVATLTTKGWGLKFNQTTVKHESSPNPRVTIKLPLAVGIQTEVFDYVTPADLVTAINERSALVSAVLASGQGAATIANFAEVAMTGGTEPAAVAADWDAALHALDGQRINAIALCDPTTSNWAQLGAYAIAKRLRGFVGGNFHNWNGVSNIATSAAALKADAATLNAVRMMLCGLGIDGQPPYLTAARYAALAGALEPSDPMTFKHLDAASIEARLDLQTTVGGVDGLLLAGVAVPVPDPDSPNTFIVSRGLSTWTGDDNMYRREHSVLAGVDAVQDLIEATLRTFLGHEATYATAQRMVSSVDQVLNDTTKQGAVVRTNGYRRESIQVLITNSVARLSAAFTPIPPLNFIDANLNLEKTEIAVQFDVSLAA